MATDRAQSGLFRLVAGAPLDQTDRTKAEDRQPEKEAGPPDGVFPKAASSRNLLIGNLALILMVLGAYGPALTGGFIWDDDFHLTKNPNLADLRGLQAIWTSKASIYYPLVLTTFWVMRRLVGLEPFAYHLLNIILHAANATLLWAILRRLRVRGAWLGAALFALHPIQVDTAAWVTELKNTQSTLFLFLSLLAFLRFWRIPERSDEHVGPQGGWGWQAAALALFALALLSKTSTVMFPGVVLLCLWWLHRKWRWQWLTAVAPYFVLSALAGAWTVWGQFAHAGVRGGEWSESFLGRLLIAGRIVWFYLGKIVWPHPLMFIYPRYTVDPSSPMAWLPVVAIVVVFALLWWKRASWGRPALMAAACYGVQIFPVLWFFSGYFTRYSYVADHFQYLPGIAIFAAAGAAMWTGHNRLVASMGRLSAATRARCVLAGLVLAILCVLTWRHTYVYRDSETLWCDTLAKNPGAWLAHYHLGLLLSDRGRAEEAIAHFRAALQQKPREEYIRVDLATTLASRGKLDEAAALYLETLEHLPTHLIALINLADVRARQRRVEEAIGLYRQAIRLNPANPDAQMNLGITLAEEGRYEEAEKHLSEAVRLEPDSAEARFNLGLAQAAGGKTDAAIWSFREALRLSPDSTEAANQLAWILATDQSEAVRNADEALHLAEAICSQTGRKHPRYLRTLAAAYAEAGRFVEAVKSAQAAREQARSGGMEELVRDIEAELRQYEAGKPHHIDRSQPVK